MKGNSPLSWALWMEREARNPSPSGPSKSARKNKRRRLKAKLARETEKQQGANDGR